MSHSSHFSRECTAQSAATLSESRVRSTGRKSASITACIIGSARGSICCCTWACIVCCWGCEGDAMAEDDEYAQLWSQSDTLTSDRGIADEYSPTRIFWESLSDGHLPSFFSSLFLSHHPEAYRTYLPLHPPKKKYQKRSILF